MTQRHINDNAAAGVTRRHFLQGTAWMVGVLAAGPGSWVVRPQWAHAAGPIKVGIATDLTGPIGLAGQANANVARMVVEQINSDGGVLGRPIELHIVDTASNESVAVGNVRKLVKRHGGVDVVLGGITSSMRNAIKDIIVKRGKTLYIYPEFYEGGECTPYLFCTGPTPAQQCDELIPWLIQNGGKRFALPAANYVWPHMLNEYARKVIEQNGGEVIFATYYPLDQVEYSATVNKIMTEKIDVVFNTVIPPGVGPFFKQLYEAGFQTRGGRLSCVYYDENAVHLNAAYEWEGLASCLDYYRVLSRTGEDPFSATLQAEYDTRYPGKSLFTAGGGATGMYRGLKLWEAAVKEAGTVSRPEVAAALDHAHIAQGPGGAATMVPGKRHCRMNMYIAVAKSGQYEIVARSDGLVDPKEC